MDILIRAKGNPSLFYLNYLFPLAILKQIIVMFFSVNGSQFPKKAQDLARFVLNKEAVHIPPDYRFYVYYNIEGGMRTTGIQSQIILNGSPTKIMSEISFPPFGYMMTIKSEPPDDRLLDITHFADYRYKEFVVKELKMKVLPTNSMFAGDYRTKDEIRRCYEENIKTYRNV